MVAVDAITGAYAGDAYPDSSGQYTVAGLGASTYKVFFDAYYTSKVQSQWWKPSAGTPDIGSASSIILPDGVAAKVSATLIEAGATIAGTMTGDNAAIAAGIAYACAMRDDAWPVLDRCEPIAASGTYALQGLRPGSFVVGFVTDGVGKTLPGAAATVAIGRTLWWADQTGINTANDVSAPADATYSGVDENVATTGGLPTFPKISGTPKVGVKLTASRGVWPNGMTPAYYWYANGAAISGATSSTFTPTAKQVGMKLSVIVYGEAGFWENPEYMTAGPTTAVAKGTLTTVAPTITGTRAVGFTLTANPGTWTSGTSFSYKWYANGVYITGTTGHKTFTLTSAQKGTRITVKATGTKSGYTTASRTSASTLKIPLTAKPTITGTRAVGYTLTAHHNTWTAYTTFSYRWYANGVFITGATHSTFKLTSAQRGKTIRVKVTGTRSGYETIARTSSSTVAIG